MHNTMGAQLDVMSTRRLINGFMHLRGRTSSVGEITGDTKLSKLCAWVFLDFLSTGLMLDRKKIGGEGRRRKWGGGFDRWETKRNKTTTYSPGIEISGSSRKSKNNL